MSNRHRTACYPSVGLSSPTFSNSFRLKIFRILAGPGKATGPRFAFPVMVKDAVMEAQSMFTTWILLIGSVLCLAATALVYPPAPEADPISF